MPQTKMLLHDLWLLLKKVLCANTFTKAEAEAYRRLKDYFEIAKKKEGK